MRLRQLYEDGRIVKDVNTTNDVNVNSISKEAGKFGFDVDKDGRPPTLSKRVKGKSTNVLFNLGLAEGYNIQLERDKELLVLHIKDTATGKRTEVRGKPGYETNYNPNDKLHQLLDKVGKSANISELMNGEVVTINPKHPDAEKAKAATDRAYKEGDKIPNPSNTFLAKADTAYDHYKIGTNLANLKSVPKGANMDEPDIMIAPYAGAKEMKYLMKQLKRIGYDVQGAAGYQDAHYDEKDIEENFADGEKKGKSRPGRVKKSGASCNGSVTALRKRAKNASGEKAKMYHWCANMKSGRKKK